MWLESPFIIGYECTSPYHVLCSEGCVAGHVTIRCSVDVNQARNRHRLLKPTARAPLNSIPWKGEAAGHSIHESLNLMIMPLIFSYNVINPRGAFSGLFRRLVKRYLGCSIGRNQACTILSLLASLKHIIEIRFSVPKWCDARPMTACREVGCLALSQSSKSPENGKICWDYAGIHLKWHFSENCPASSPRSADPDVNNGNGNGANKGRLTRTITTASSSDADRCS